MMMSLKSMVSRRRKNFPVKITWMHHTVPLAGSKSCKKGSQIDPAESRVE